MWAFLFQPHTMPFTMALALVGAIGVIELLGLIFGISFWWCYTCNAAAFSRL